MKVLSGKSSRGKSLAPFELRFGAGFVALFAIIYFFDSEGIMPALVPTIAVHELGHMAALIIMGASPTRLDATLLGFRLDYVSDLKPAGALLAALSGPALGLAYAFFCAACGRRWENDFLLLSAGLGVIINGFNLIPVFPLDGGRALYALLTILLDRPRAKWFSQLAGLALSVLLTMVGLYFLLIMHAPALIAPGLWLLLMQARQFTGKRGSCKKGCKSIQ